MRVESRVQRPSFWWPEEVCQLFPSQCHWLLGKILLPRPSISCFEGPHYALICFSASCRQLLCWEHQLKSTNSERCTGWLVYLTSLVSLSFYLKLKTSLINRSRADCQWFCLVMPATNYLYLPIFYKLQVTSAYEVVYLRRKLKRTIK